VLLRKAFSTTTNSSLPVRRSWHHHLNERRRFRDEVRLPVAAQAYREAYENQDERQSLHTSIVSEAANVCNGSKAAISGLGRRVWEFAEALDRSPCSKHSSSLFSSTGKLDPKSNENCRFLIARLAANMRISL
jgi:hypothetical protein